MGAGDEILLTKRDSVGAGAEMLLTNRDSVGAGDKVLLCNTEIQGAQKTGIGFNYNNNKSKQVGYTNKNSGTYTQLHTDCIASLITC